MLRIGPAGWKYKDWEGVVYPQPKPRGFDELEYISRYFPTVEINTSFYGPPRASSAKKWLESVQQNRDFRFTAKLYRSFTHVRKPEPKDEADFKDGMAPIVEAGKLGALLVQFPWSFKAEPENREYLLKVHRMFSEYPVVVELRHSSWISEEMLDVLAERGIGICNIDQPLFKRSVEPAAFTTSGVGYVRLHGRNYQQWFSAKADVRERYDYLYSAPELEPWADRIRTIERDVDDVYAVTNNHHVGKAVVNALELAAMLGEVPPEIPEVVAQHYPRLADLTRRGV